MKKVLDLIVLQRILFKMSGIELMDELDKIEDTQIDARGGGPVLRLECAGIGIQSSQRKVAERLKKDLKKSSLFPLLILLAQQLRNLPHLDIANHTKIVSYLYDELNKLLFLYVEFLSITMTRQEYAAHLMTQLDELVQKYHLDVGLAFFLLRPVLPLFYSEPVFRDTIPENEKKQENETKSAEMASLDDAMRSIFPKDLFSSVPILLVKLFWELSLYDIEVPSSAYAKEILKQTKELQEMQEGKNEPPGTAGNGSMEPKTVQAKEETISALKKESSLHQQHHKQVHANLEKIKEELVHQMRSLTANSFGADKFLQYCVYPRCVSFRNLKNISYFKHHLESKKGPS